MRSFNFRKFKKIIPVRSSNGKLYRIPQSKLLKILLAQHAQSVYLKGNTFELTIPAGFYDLPAEEKFSFTLDNDIVRRLSLTSQTKVPIIIHKPYRDEHGVRQVKPHILYLPVPNDPKAKPRFSLLASTIDLSSVPTDTVKDKDIQGSLGIGSFGVVFPVWATIETDDEDAILKTDKERVLKVIPQHSEFDALEASFLLRTGYSGAKDLVIDEANRSYILQKKGKKELWDVIQEDQNGTSILTVKQRYEYSISFLKGIHRQIHERGIVSRDVKPQNALLDPKHPRRILNIDFGLAKTLLSQDKVRCGSPAFAAPEILVQYPNPADECVDVFSAGMSLAYLWRMPDSCLSPQARARNRQIKFKEDLPGLFRGILATFYSDPTYTIDNRESQQISGILNKMLHYNPKYRATLEYSIEQLQLSYIDYQVRSAAIPQAHKQSVIDALTISNKMEESLDSIAKPDEYLYDYLSKLKALATQKNIEANHIEQATNLLSAFNTLDKSFTQAEQKDQMIDPSKVEALSTLLQQIKNFVPVIENSLGISNDPTEQLRKVFSDSIDQLADNPSAINTFLQNLEIECLPGIKTKAALRQQVNDIITDYQEHLLSLNTLSGSVPENPKLQQKIENFHKKILSKPVTLDNLFLCNKKIATAKSKIEIDIDYQRRKEHYDAFFAMVQCAFTVSEKLERNKKLLKNISGSNHLMGTIKTSIAIQQDEINKLIKNFTDLKTVDLLDDEFTQFIEKHTSIVEEHEKEVNKKIQQLQESPTIKDIDRKHFILLSLEMQIDKITNLKDLEKLYKEMGQDTYRLLRKERGWLRFHKEGATKSWSKAIDMLQEKGYELFFENYNISETQYSFLQALFSEERRHGKGKPFLQSLNNHKKIHAEPIQVIRHDA